MPEPLRIGNCSGFYGDRLSAMRELLGPDRMEICRSLAEPDRMLAACRQFARRR